MTKSTIVSRLSRHFSDLRSSRSRRRQAAARQASAGLECLEQRKLLSASGNGIMVEEIALDNGGHRVEVTGTDGDDVIELRTNRRSDDGFDIYGNGELIYSGDFFADGGLRAQRDIRSSQLGFM